MHVPFAIDLRPSPDEGHVVEVTLDLSSTHLEAGAHAATRVLQDRYRVPVLESVDEILAMRELTWLADGLAAPVPTGQGVRLTLTVARLGRLREALETFVAGREDGVLRDNDANLLPDANALLDGIVEAHAAAIRAALEANAPTYG
jgi:hypothetical protein